MARFLITGLPRSRTAWMAVVANARHEPISLHGPGWLAEWNDGGVSDAGAAMCLRFILDKLQPKTLIIERDKADVIASLRRYMGDTPFDWEAGNAWLDQALRGLQVDHPLIRRVAYRDLADLGTVEASLEWLEVPAPPHLGQLLHMNIQSELRYNMSLYRERAA